MFCPKCGNGMEEGISICSNCGLDISKIESSENNNEHCDGEAVAPEVIAQKAEKNNKAVTAVPIIRYVYFALAAVVLIMFFVAASSIVSGGNGIMMIQSVGGQTLEEAYYYELGAVYAGYAMITRALGIFFASVLVWLGLKN